MLLKTSNGHLWINQLESLHTGQKRSKVLINANYVPQKKIDRILRFCDDRRLFSNPKLTNIRFIREFKTEKGIERFAIPRRELLLKNMD